MHMQMNRLSYLGMGLGIGLAAAILYAPKSGVESRRYLKTKAGDAGRYVKGQGERLSNFAGEAVRQGQQKIQHGRQNFQAAIEAGRDAYREAIRTTPSGQRA
jgi:gas vesicle protein